MAATTMAFGDLLRRYRLGAALSQEALAERAGLSTDAIRALERGRRGTPRPDTVAVLSSALGLPPADREILVTAAVRARRPVAEPPTSVAPPPTKPPRPLSALPAPLAPLVGREREMADLAGLLQEPATGKPLPRLIMLTGPGGIGKTRLAIAVAMAVQDAYADGAAFVDLSALRDPTLVVSSIARALGVRETAPHGALALLTDFLRERHLLLVLDNLEQVVECAPQIAQLVAACPRLTVLATSRAPLRVRSEQRVHVPPLATPPAEAAAHGDPATYAALRLFEERARAVQPDFALAGENVEVVAAICRHLDGLPLAIELAAARIPLLPPRALLSRLEHSLAVLRGGARDMPARQQTLRATIDWSYALLPSQDQLLFRRFSVFAGGWTAETLLSPEWAALSPAGDAHDAAALPEALLDSLASLVDQSLVVVQAPGTSPGPWDGTASRFVLLETIREYAREQLAASGEQEAVCRAHATHYLALAEQAEPQLKEAQQMIWLARLLAEHDNLRAALQGTLERGEVDLSLRLGAGLWRFWYMAGHIGEGRRWLDRLLAQEAALSPQHAVVRAWVLRGASVLAARQGDLEQGAVLATASLGLQRALGDRAGMASALNTLGNIAREQGDLGRAVALYEESLALRRAQNDERGMAVVLNNLGTTVCYQGDLARAAALHDQSLALRRAHGDTWGEANALHNLAQVAFAQGNLRRAATLAEASLALHRDLGDKQGMALSLAFQGALGLAQRQAATAMAAYDEALALSRTLADRLLTATALDGLAAVAAAWGQGERADRLATSAATMRQRPLAAAEQAYPAAEVAALEALLHPQGPSRAGGRLGPPSLRTAEQADAWGRQLQVARLQDE